MSNQDLSQQHLMARAMRDEAFRQRLLSNPRQTLERELSDAELEQVVGRSQVTGDCGTQAPLTHCDTDYKCQSGQNIQ